VLEDVEFFLELVETAEEGQHTAEQDNDEHQVNQEYKPVNAIALALCVC